MIGNLLLVLLAVAGGWVAVGAFLRGRYPVWYWLGVGYPVTVARMYWHWRALCMQRGLTGPAMANRLFLGGYSVQAQAVRPPVPRLIVGRPMRDGLGARVLMLAGQEVGEYAKCSGAMEQIWRVHTVRVSNPQRRWVELRVYHADPIPGVVVRDPHAPDPPPDPSQRPYKGMSLAPVVGVREDGTLWVIDLRRVAHLMIVGITQSGKSTLLHALVVALAPLPVALVGIDLKGGLELSLYGPRLSGLAVDKKEAADLLDELLALAQERMAACRAAGVQSVWSLPVVPPPVLVLVDEVAELYLHADSSGKALRDRCASGLLRLAQIGAALGFHVIVSGQRIGSDLGPGVTALRAQLGGRVCHRVADEETAKMTLGDVAPDAVQVALMLTAAQQGFAVATDDAGGWSRVRSALTSAEQAAGAAARYAPLTPALPGITRPGAAGGGLAWW
ncbi:MAG: FtsK/SpoIIIE domain-containing protein [Sciscionella sp.]